MKKELSLREYLSENQIFFMARSNPYMHLELTLRYPAHKLKNGAFPDLFKALKSMGATECEISPYGDFSTITTNIKFEKFKKHLGDPMDSLT